MFIPPLLYGQFFADFDAPKYLVPQLGCEMTDLGFMSIAKTLFIGFAFTLAAACGSSTLDDVEAAKDKVCGCKDKACALKVKKETKGLRDKIKEMTNEDKLKAMKFGEQAAACYAKLG